MGLSSWCSKPIREVNIRGVVRELLNGKDMYKKMKNSSGYCVNCQSKVLFGVDVLNTKACMKEYFYIDENTKEITMLDGYSDLWYSLNIGVIKKKTYKDVKYCLTLLRKSGFSSADLIMFIKSSDGFYHLNINSEDYGYLGDDDGDAEYKGMLTSIFKDIKCSAEVVILPSNGLDMFFSDSVCIYRTKEDFYEASISRKIASLALDEVACSLEE